MILWLCGLAAAMDRPHLSLAVSSGLPDLAGGAIEVFVTPEVSIEVGAGIGLVPLSVHAGARWTSNTPQGWDGHHLRVAPGGSVFVFPQIPEEGMAVADVDVAWVWTGTSAGVQAGVRFGAGATWGVGSEGEVKIEPALEVLPLRVGVIF